MSENSVSNSLFDLNGKPSIQRSFPIALQHLLAMIVGNTLPALVLANTLKGTEFAVSSNESVYIIQAGMFIAAIATMLQLYPVYKVGAKLPVVMGVSFAYIPILIEIGLKYGYGAVFGAEIAGGFVAIIVGLFIGRIRKYFPPIVSGTVVLTIGLSLYPVAINYMAGGAGSPLYGTKWNWIVAIITLAVVLLCNMFGKGIVKLAAILIGIVAGYIASLIINSTVLPGFMNFSNVVSAEWFTYPHIMPFKPEFKFSAVIVMSIMYIVNSVQAVGDISSTTIGGLDREPTDSEISGSIVCNGVSSVIGGLIGALPTATYSQNVGIVSMTKVVARRVLALTSAMILIAGFIPKFGGLMMSIPQCVIGGATISVFAQITMNGMKLITSEELSIRNSTIVGLGVALGMGITQVPASTEVLKATYPTLHMIFTSSPVIIATMVVFFLNIILPNKSLAEEQAERDEMEQ
ncbi:uracil-xanthine permease family protein [Anaerosphaera multitolerans]|uniref:Purine permease n=1 Tax=Anaerosphaera multitolerans TaxID=2487351 RepID=A0A437S537_9FIRM|nr:nucleobase:cation symporter-2 family protein [Anaerosphaera multitolerans]RVU54120.1 purine permease [Anaerosphaera multitolerans]